MESAAQGVTTPESSSTRGDLERPGPVLLAVHGLAEPTEALRRAGAMAGALQVFLTVLRIRRSAGHAASVTAAEPEPSDAEAAERTAAWVRAELGDTRRADRIVLSRAGFDSEVVHTARMARASMVVLASDAEQRAEHATYLALRSGVPVLVARTPRPGGAILAATDLDTSDFPVLRRAAALARRSSAALVFVHNVPPATAEAAFAAPGEAPPVERATRLERAAAALARVRSELAPAAAMRISEAETATDAVLAIAAELDADLLVVGARQRSWLGRVLGGLMAERTAWRAPGSVLIVPMPAAGTSRL